MSEKMDGIRAYWNGENSLSRHGKRIGTPNWFTEGFPNIPLDGELWMGRKTFEQLMAVIGGVNNSDWKGVGYFIFDLPASAAPYEDRLKQLEGLKPVVPPHVQFVESVKCRGHSYLNSYLDTILEQGGEGIVV